MQAKSNKLMAVQPKVDLKVLLPNCIVNTDKPLLQIVNDSDVELNLHAGYVLGYAMEVDQILNDDLVASGNMPVHNASDKQPETDTASIMELTKTNKTESNADKHEVPAHMKVLYDKSVKGLSDSEKSVLQSVLTDYADVFARHDLDIGLFEHFEHEIDTQDSRPIKQQMRRIPLEFESEEEA